MKIYNSAARKKEEFHPLNDKKVSLYVCGITPNNATHLGHAFTYVSFDVLVRYLRYRGYTVNYVQNATDVNDSEDVIQQAKESGKTWHEIADFWIQHFQKQMDTLNVLRPNHYVKASTVIPSIIQINERLLEKGYAYVKNETVYYDISKFKEYGELSKFTPEQMLLISRERGNNPGDHNKKSPLDFVLWFGSRDTPNWKSPFGVGRPGWHIECNAIINQYLGDQIDIHGGGRDLIFPHHESEIAQNEPYTGKSPYVKYWMHVGMVLYEGEKMSKSLGNLVLVEDLLNKYSPNAIRWLLLCHYWRQPWEYEESELEEAEDKMKTIKETLKDMPKEKLSPDLAYFETIMDDDLYSPRALEWLYAMIERKENIHTVQKSLEILGFSF